MKTYENLDSGALRANIAQADDAAASTGAVADNATPSTEDNIVAVIDTGVDYTNPDLANNMWSNPGNIAGAPGQSAPMATISTKMTMTPCRE